MDCVGGFLDIGWFQFVLKECVPVTWEKSTVKYSILFYTPLIAREMYSVPYRGCFPLFYGFCAMSAHVAY